MKTLITCHSNADFDAFASLIGAHLLYPHSVMLFPGTQEANLQNYIKDIASKHYTFISPKDLQPEEFSQLVVTDTNQPSRLAHVAVLLDNPQVQVIVYDHHQPTEEDLCPTHFYYEPVGSTSSIILQELEKMNFPLKTQEATLLFLGIHVDTGSFTYSSTTEVDFKAAAFAWKFTIDTAQLAHFLKTDLTPQHIKALNELLESAEVHEINQISIVIATTTSEDYLHDFAMLAPKFMEMQPCHVFFALARMKDKVQILARSSTQEVNVGKVCQTLNGGGHVFAASATVKQGTFPEIKDLIMKEIYLQIHPNKTAGMLYSSPPIGIFEHQSMGTAAKLMARYGFKAIPVFKNHSKICVGWISQEQAARGTALNKETTNSPVSIYMQRGFEVVDTKATLQELMDIIVGAKQRLVPVVAYKQAASSQEALKQRPLLGIITRTDLIRLFSDENTILPLPSKHNEQKERNLAKPLKEKTVSDCYELLVKAGELAEKMGIQVSVVGGFVRDLLMEQKQKEWPQLDVDLVVEGDGIQFAFALAKCFNGRVKEHSPFLTAMLIFINSKGIECKVDIATARLEYYEQPAALPTVEVSSLKMDLYRRDFTINAMAIRLNPPQFGLLVDYFEGQKDIRNKKIRMLHTLSFVEDPTRSLRAIRFEQRYNFNIGPQCARLMQSSIDSKLIDKLSGSRITGEIELILKEENIFNFIKRMEDFNLFYAIHPLLKMDQSKEDLVKNVLETFEWYKKLYLKEADGLLLLILSLTRQSHASDLAFVLQRFHFIEKRRDYFINIRSYIISLYPALEKWHKNNQPISELCALLYKVPVESILYSIARTNQEEIKKALSQYIYKWQHEKPDITGKDLEKLNVPKGKIYQILLKLALNSKLDNVAPTRETQLELIEKYLEEEKKE